MHGKITEFRLDYGPDKEHKLWIASPDISALIKEASPIVNHEFQRIYFTLRNEAIYLNCIYDARDNALINLTVLQTMPVFEFSAENVALDSSSAGLKCDWITISSEQGFRTCPLGSGIGNYVEIYNSIVGKVENRIFDYDSIYSNSDTVFAGKQEWFDDASAVLNLVAEKIQLVDWHKKYWSELPELLRREEEKERIENENKKPKGLLARIFGRN